MAESSFGMNKSANEKRLVAVRGQIIGMHKTGATVSQIVQELGICKKTVYK